MSFFLLAILRPYILFLLVPVYGIVILTSLFPKQVFIKYLIYYALGLICIAIVGQWIPALNLFEKFRFIQYHYLVYYDKGNSFIYLPFLIPTLKGIVQISPIALYNISLGPFLIELDSVFKYLAALENIFFLLFILLALFFHKLPDVRLRPFLYALLFFGITYFLLMGILVNNVGSLVRYRSVPLLFVLCFFYLLLDEEKTRKVLRGCLDFILRAENVPF